MYKNNKTLTVLNVERLNNTYYNNPRYKINSLEGVYITKSNSSHVYSFNYNKLERGDVVNVYLTKNNRIIDITLIASEF